MAQKRKVKLISVINGTCQNDKGVTYQRKPPMRITWGSEEEGFRKVLHDHFQGIRETATNVYRSVVKDAVSGRALSLENYVFNVSTVLMYEDECGDTYVNHANFDINPLNLREFKELA